jgi:hypothetical protein
MVLLLPFAAKEMSNGKKLFRRAHGYKIALVSEGDAVLTIAVPYAVCKIQEAEILWCPAGVCVDFKVLDKAEAPLYGTPNAVLSQFGFDINVAKDFYKDFSPYDADLVLNMQLQITLKNPTTETNIVGVNIPFHEVV